MIEATAAFERLVEAHTRHLYCVAFSITRRTAEAEDAVQETMTRAWKVWRRGPAIENPRAWLTRICVNYCLNRERATWRTLLMDPGDIPRQPVAAVEDALIDFDRAYRRLSVQQRAVVALYYQHDHSIEDCARVLGCRPGTVRSHLARGVEKLRQELRDD